MNAPQSARQSLKQLVTLCLVLATGWCAAAAPEAADLQAEGKRVIACVQAMIKPGDHWTSPFTQTQHLAVLSTPLHSTGEIELNRGEVRWTVLTPIRQTLTIDAKGRMQSDDGTTMDHPAVANLVKMLLTLDTAGLNSTFVTSGTCAAGAWALSLLPKNPGIAALFERIEVRGGTVLGEVILRARGGDWTSIVFAADSSTPSAATGESPTPKSAGSAAGRAG